MVKMVFFRENVDGFVFIRRGWSERRAPKMRYAIVWVCVFVWAVVCVGLAGADCGSIPFYAPVLDPISLVTAAGTGGAGGSGSAVAPRPKVVQFDPLKVTVFEPQQRAIILWNGTEEILLLSTDQKATQQAGVLEVIPLPSEPKVRLGSFSTFQSAQKMVVQKRMWATAHGGAKASLAEALPAAGVITFEQRMGAHALAVAQVLDKDRFVDFVQSYLREHYKTENAPIRPEFVSIIESYLKEGFRWFTFDVITLDGTARSRQPIEYRFASDCVFYPLRISSLEGGVTRLDLLVFTEYGANRFLGISDRQMRKDPRLNVTLSEVESLDSTWKGFFPQGGNGSVALDQLGLKGESSKLLTDVRVK